MATVDRPPDRPPAAQYDSTYGRFGDELYSSIRAEAFGEDIGQNSWLTADELRTFCRWLEIDRGSELLDVACGSGGPALFVADTTGCRVIGVDLHDAAVATANRAARDRGLDARARFLRADTREPLPFEDASVDAVICIDSINHVYERGSALREWRRVLHPGGRALFTNPITVTGLLRREEMLTRSYGIGEFVFTPPGLDERLLREAGFDDIRVTDMTESSVQIATAWRAARERRAAELDEIEGVEQNASTQRFLATAAELLRERRLSRLAYLAHRV